MAQQDAEADTKRENKEEDGKVYLNHRLILVFMFGMFFYSHTNPAILIHRERLYTFKNFI